MISAIELINVLTCLLRENFPETKIEDRDIEEGFDRPSFFIDVPKFESGKTGELYSDNQGVEIHYFASCRKIGYLECLQVRNKLRYLLADNLRLKSNEDFVFAFENIEYYISKKDKTLLAKGEVLFVQEDDRVDETPNLEELIVNLNTEKPKPKEERDQEDEDFIQKIE